MFKIGLQMYSIRTLEGNLMDHLELAAKLGEKGIVVTTKVGDGGKLFGSITSMDIAAALKEQTGHEVDKKKIVLSKPIKETGDYTVEIKLYQGVAAKVNVKIQG